MQRPRLTIGADAIPVVESKRGVARLLDLRHDQTRSQRMDGSGGDEHAIAGCRLEEVQAVFGRLPGRGCVCKVARSTPVRSPA